MSPHDEGILLYALRYALGRQTYAAGEVQATIRAAMPIRDAGVRGAMIADIQEAQHLATSTRDYRMALGDPRIDAPGWIALLKDLEAQGGG